MDFGKIRHKTARLLRSRGVPIHPYLPLLDDGSIRPPREIADRIFALYCLAGIPNGADPELLLEWIASEGGEDAFECDERAVFEMKSMNDSLMNELSWKVESLYVLAWVAGMFDVMGWPDKGADLSGVFPLIPPEVEFGHFREGLKSIDSVRILEALDLYYNIHASLSHPELWGEGLYGGALKIEVVEERRHALEWVCSNSTEWSDITLDT